MYTYCKIIEMSLASMVSAAGGVTAGAALFRAVYVAQWGNHLTPESVDTLKGLLDDEHYAKIRQVAEEGAEEGGKEQCCCCC